MSVVGELFSEFCLLSFVAFGGATALLTVMHRVVVDHHHWLDDTTFTHLYAIAQAAPGPNVLVSAASGPPSRGGRGAPPVRARGIGDRKTTPARYGAMSLQKEGLPPSKLSAKREP